MNTDGKKSRVIIILLVGLLFVFLVATGIILLITKEGKEKKLTEIREEAQKVIPQLYPGRVISRNDPTYLRGLFDKIENNYLFLVLNSETGNASTKQIPLNKGENYGCVSRYMALPDGRQLDRFDVFIDTSGSSGSNASSGRPKKNLDWFSSIVERGEAVEVRFKETDATSLEPVEIYVYKNTCPAE